MQEEEEEEAEDWAAVRPRLRKVRATATLHAPFSVPEVADNSSRAIGHCPARWQPVNAEFLSTELGRTLATNLEF